MSSSSTNSKKLSKTSEEPSSVQRLLASLQQAQNRGNSDSGGESSTCKPGRNKKPEEKKKTNCPSVGARMHQQAGNVQLPKPRQRQRGRGGRGLNSKKNPPGSEQTQKSSSYPTYPQYLGPRIPVDVLDELEFRFISNMVDSEINDHIRMCFHLELAHWYYLDHMVEDEKYTGCPIIGPRDFTVLMCLHCQVLRKYAHQIDEVILKFREYKSTVPTYGAILVDPEMEHVLLVQSYFAKGNSWGFPKGKINQDEPPRDAAIRETYEETGFDFGAHSEKEKKFQRFMYDGMIRLYLVKNVPRDFKFEPQTRKEIRKIQWFKIDDLPTDKTDTLPPYLHGFKFFMVIPFVRDIQNYIQKEKEKLRRKQAASSSAPEAASTSASTSELKTPSIFSQLFPNIPETNQINAVPNNLVDNSVVNEELFSAYKNCPGSEDKQEAIQRPTLPEMSPAVDGLDSLAILGLCTPLKPGASLNVFSTSPQTFPIIPEEALSPLEFNSNDLTEKFGFAMPTDLKQPVVTSDHPWQHHKSTDGNSPVQSLESHQGWLDTQLVNTIMHSPNAPILSSHSPATPTSILGHLIGKPIQPQAIFPIAATPTDLGSAEKPKSSRISLSDNSAFKAINSSQKHSIPKTTAPPNSEKTRSASLSGSAQPNRKKAARNLFNSVTSPVSSGMQSVHEDDHTIWDDVWFRDQLATTARTSVSSLAASNQELAMINRDTLIEESKLYINRANQAISNQPKIIQKCSYWNKKIQLDAEYIVGPMSYWMDRFSLKPRNVGSQ